MRVPGGFALLLTALAACSSSTTEPPNAGVREPRYHYAQPNTCPSQADAGITDGCEQPSDCGAGMGCLCGTYYNFFHSPIPNECVTARCLSDADCGANGYCSLSLACGAGNSTTGYFCRTANDSCEYDGDCTNGGPCNFNGLSWSCGACIIE